MRDNDLHQAATTLVGLAETLDEVLLARPGDHWAPFRCQIAWDNLRCSVISVGRKLASEDARPLVSWMRRLGQACRRFDQLLRDHGLGAILYGIPIPSGNSYLQSLTYPAEGLFAPLIDDGRRLLVQHAPPLADPFAFADCVPSSKHERVEPVGDLDVGDAEESSAAGPPPGTGYSPRLTDAEQRALNLYNQAFRQLSENGGHEPTIRAAFDWLVTEESLDADEYEAFKKALGRARGKLREATRETPRSAVPIEHFGNNTRFNN